MCLCTDTFYCHKKDKRQAIVSWTEKNHTDSIPKISKRIQPFRCLEKKTAFKEKGKPFLTARVWFPFKFPLLDSTHYAIVPLLICYSNQFFCQILIPLSVAGWLNGCLPVGLMSLLPFRNRTKLPERGWNGERHKLWLWVLLKCRRVSPFIFIHLHHRVQGFGFYKDLCLNVHCSCCTITWS